MFYCLLKQNVIIYDAILSDIASFIYNKYVCSVVERVGDSKGTKMDGKGIRKGYTKCVQQC